MDTEKPSNCVICLEPISPDSGVVDCGHTFCAKCIKHWCEQCSACPLCRKEITRIKVFYRSFYMGQNILVEHKKQAIPNNDEPFEESDFIASDTEELFIMSQDLPRYFKDDDFKDEGTIWTNGSRHSLRESHRFNQAIEQRLSKLKIQLKNEKNIQDKINNDIKFLINYVDKCINSNKIEPQYAEQITNSITDQIRQGKGSIDNFQIKQMVEANILRKPFHLSNLHRHVSSRLTNRI